MTTDTRPRIPAVGVGAGAGVAPTLLQLLPSFTVHLKAENKSPRTVEAYASSVRHLSDFLSAAGMPTAVAHVTREHVEAFLADQLHRLKATSARSRYRSIQQFWRWAAAEGEVTRNPMAGMSPPAVPEQPVPILTDEELRALLRTCERPRPDFFDVRDAALLRLFVDTGARLAEIATLSVPDVDLDSGLVHVMGKGRRRRALPMGTKSLRAVDRWLRVRGRHPDAARLELWLGRQGPLTAFGVAEVVDRRGRQAGLGHLNPHRLRHSVAHRWRLHGGDDDALLRLMGWRSREMLHRYGSSAADERAIEAHRRLALGDRL